MPIGGWNEAFAQMIGLWLKRKPMPEEQRKGYINQFFPFYSALLKEGSNSDNFVEQKMFVGIQGIAHKPGYSQASKLISKTNVKEQKKYHSQHKINDKCVSTKVNKDKIIVIQGGFPAISATFIIDQMTGLINRGYEIENWSTYIRKENVIHPDIFKYNLLSLTKYLKLPDENIKNRLDIWTQHFIKMNNLTKLNMVDVFHVHYGANFNLLQPLFEFFHNKYVIVSFHGYDASKYFKENVVSCYDYLFKRANLITTPSFKMKSELVKRGCSPKKILIHRYGIDLDKFNNLDGENKKSNINLLTVARLVEKKGLEYSLRAFARLLNNEEINYKIIGDGPLKNYLEELAYKLGINEQIIFLGARTKTDVIKEMACADIFLLNSVTARDGDKEGLPVSLIEAQAMGLPVISSFHAGIPELVIDGKTGYLTKEKDVNQITCKLNKLIKDEQLRKEMSSNATK